MPAAFVYLQVAGNQAEAMSKADFLKTPHQSSCKPKHKPSPVPRLQELSVTHIQAAPREQGFPSGLLVCHGAISVTAAHKGASHPGNLSLKTII